MRAVRQMFDVVVYIWSRLNYCCITIHYNLHICISSASEQIITIFNYSLSNSTPTAYLRVSKQPTQQFKRRAALRLRNDWPRWLEELNFTSICLWHRMTPIALKDSSWTALRCVSTASNLDIPSPRGGVSACSCGITRMRILGESRSALAVCLICNEETCYPIQYISAH